MTRVISSPGPYRKNFPNNILSRPNRPFARELSGLKDNPRSSRSRFRGRRRYSQIHRPTGHAVIFEHDELAAAGFEPTSTSCLPQLWP
jgi:hypothetical protein